MIHKYLTRTEDIEGRDKAFVVSCDPQIIDIKPPPVQEY